MGEILKAQVWRWCGPALPSFFNRQTGSQELAFLGSRGPSSLHNSAPAPGPSTSLSFLTVPWTADGPSSWDLHQLK